MSRLKIKFPKMPDIKFPEIPDIPDIPNIELPDFGEDFTGDLKTTTTEETEIKPDGTRITRKITTVVDVAALKCDVDKCEFHRGHAGLHGEFMFDEPFRLKRAHAR